MSESTNTTRAAACGVVAAAEGDTMADPQIRAIRERWERATPGPWAIGPDGAYNAIWGNGKVVLVASVEGADDEVAIAAAPEDIRILLARIDDLEAAIDSSEVGIEKAGY